jgi:hypothetical protein
VVDFDAVGDAARAVAASGTVTINSTAMSE